MARMFSLQAAAKANSMAAVKQIGKNITGVQGDVSNLADLDRLYATVKEQKGRIDILFANAWHWRIRSIGSNYRSSL